MGKTDLSPDSDDSEWAALARGRQGGCRSPEQAVDPAWEVRKGFQEEETSQLSLKRYSSVNGAGNMHHRFSSKQQKPPQGQKGN